MSRGVQTIDFDPIDVDPNVLFTIATISAAVGAEVTLTLAADLGEAAGVGRRIFLDNPTMTETNDNTTWTITGTDADGRAQVDTMTDVEDNSSATVGKNVSNKFFNTVSGITMNDVEVDITNAVIGTNGAMCSRSIQLDHAALNAPCVQLVETGTLAFSVETTLQDLNDSAAENQGDVVWAADGNHSGLTATQQATLADWPVTFLRLITTSYSNGGEISLLVRNPPSSY